MSFTEELLQIFSSAIHDTIIDKKHSSISSGECHHAERISCKMTDTWKLQSVVSPPLENVSTPAMSKPRPARDPVSFSLLCMYSSPAWVEIFCQLLPRTGRNLKNLARSRRLLTRIGPAPEALPTGQDWKTTKNPYNVPHSWWQIFSVVHFKTNGSL